MLQLDQAPQNMWLNIEVALPREMELPAWGSDEVLEQRSKERWEEWQRYHPSAPALTD